MDYPWYNDDNLEYPYGWPGMSTSALVVLRSQFEVCIKKNLGMFQLNDYFLKKLKKYLSEEKGINE